MLKIIKSLSAAILLSVMAVTVAQAEADKPAYKPVDWQHTGLFGTYDRAAAQRGLQVYREVCAACHALGQVAIRSIADLGFSEDEIKALAKEYTYEGGPDDEGEMFERPGQPSDKFPAPFANEKAARASNGGAYPPDLSLIVKARKGFEDYVYSLLLGYEDAPADFDLPEGANYNLYFPGNKVAMPEPLSDGAVEYADGTEATKAQMAKDVTVFLAWAAEPKLEQRKNMGLRVFLFLLLMSGLLLAVKKKIWKDVH